MRLREHFVRWMAVAIACGAATGAWALDPHRSLTQYSRKVWTQAEGLPQDTIRAIAQTADGYLWLGTEEGLARFDGYEFTIFDKRDGGLPSNYVTALAATADGALWIGTAAGLTEYRDRRFRTYTTRDGLPEDDAIMGLYAGHDRTLWIVAGGWLSHFENGRFTNYAPGPLTAVLTAFEAGVGSLDEVAARTGLSRDVVDGAVGHLVRMGRLEQHELTVGCPTAGCGTCASGASDGSAGCGSPGPSPARRGAVPVSIGLPQRRGLA